MAAQLLHLLRRGAPVLAALGLLAGLHLFVRERMPEDALATGLGALELSAPLSRFLAYYLLGGGLAALLLAWGLLRLAPRAGEWLQERLGQGSDRRFLLAASILAFALAALAYQYLLQRMPLTDDETAYLFSSRTLAEGRLFLPSDADKDFFDHVFLVNDGRVYSQYFLGWPALLLPLLLLGLEGYANAVYFALTVPLVFLILRRLAGPTWARLGALLMLASPMLAISAGTLLAHTSCTAALAAFLYCALRCREPGASAWWSAALAATFCAAFFNRPLTAVGLGLPVLLAWLWALRRRPAGGRELLAFAAPALLGAGLFLGVNAAQTGDPLRTAYQSYLSYSTGGRDLQLHKEMAFISVAHSVSTAVAAFFRLNFSAFGWPCSWLFVGLAGALPFRRVLLATIPSFFAANLLAVHVGIDTYAPMHFLELGLPMVLLTTLGIERTTAWAAELARTSEAGGGRRRPLAGIPLVAALASTAVAFFFFLPYQSLVVWKTARLEKISRAGAELLPAPAVIFVKRPYVELSCFRKRPDHWVHQPPINSPDLGDDRLWLLHTDLERDRELMARRFPDRAGFLLTWKPQTCIRSWVPLAEARAEDFPPDPPLH